MTKKITVEKGYNCRGLNYLANMSLEDFCRFSADDEEFCVATKEKRKWTHAHIVNVCREMLSRDECKREFENDLNRGRVYCHHSTQGFPSWCKGLIYDGVCTDIDMKNAHPKILKYKMAQASIDCPQLQYGVDNRDVLIKKYQGFKTDVIEIINGSGKPPSNEFIKMFKAECKTTIPKLLEIPENAKYYDLAKKKGKEAKAAVFFLMEDMEVEIIEIVEKFLATKNIEICLYMHDGLFVYGNHYDNPELLVEIAAAVNEKFPGLDCSFTYKKHSTVTVPDSYVEKKYTSILNDKEVAEALFEEHKDHILVNNGVIYALFNNMWTEDYERAFNAWFQDADDLLIDAGKKGAKFVSSATSKWPMYSKQLFVLCMKNLKSEDRLNNEKDLLPFLDGIYDFKTATFTKHEDAAKVPYFTYAVQRNFPTNVDPAVSARLHSVILDVFDGNAELMDEFFSFEARGLSNHVEDKVGRVIVGERNSGKGLFVAFVQNAFKGVVKTVIANDLVSKKNSSESAERQNGFLKNFCDGLLCYSEEASADKDSRINGTLWKSATSGGDTVSYRAAYGTLTTSRVRALYSITCNATPKFTTADAYDNLLICNMPCKYMDVLPQDVESIECGFTIKQGDCRIKELTKDEKYLDAFVLLALAHYKPTKPEYPIMREACLSIAEVEENHVSPFDGLKLSFEAAYVITFDANDKVQRSTLHTIVTSRFPDASPQKIGKFLEKKGVLVKKIRGTMYYCGVKRIELSNY